MKIRQSFDVAAMTNNEQYSWSVPGSNQLALKVKQLVSTLFAKCKIVESWRIFDRSQVHRLGRLTGPAPLRAQYFGDNNIACAKPCSQMTRIVTSFVA